MKKQTDIAQKQYNILDNTNKFDRIIKKEKPTVKKYNRSNLIYDNKHSFYEYYDIKKFNSHSLESNLPILASFDNDLNKYNTLKPQKGCTKEKKKDSV